MTDRAVFVLGVWVGVMLSWAIVILHEHIAMWRGKREDKQ